MKFLSDVEQSFDTNVVLNPKEFAAFQKIIHDRQSFLNQEIAQDGEFTRELWKILNRRISADGMIDQKQLEQEIQNLRLEFQTDRQSPKR